MSRRLSVAALVVLLSGCTKDSTDTMFELGGAEDPVVQMALSTEGVDLARATFTNGTTRALTEGILTFQPLFAEDEVASDALNDYVLRSSALAGNAQALIDALGLTTGTDAWIVPAIARSSSVTVQFFLPGEVHYLARIDGSRDDFVGARVRSTTDDGAPSVDPLEILGYDINGGPGGSVGGGNGTTGTNPQGTFAEVVNLDDCSEGPVVNPLTLHTDTFNQGVLDPLWPGNVPGYAGDFNADWYTDGESARVNNPDWEGIDPDAPALPVTSGFVRFMDFCPQSSSTLSMEASVVTDLTASDSDTTLVLYFFDKDNALLGVEASLPLGGGNTRTLSLLDVAVPGATRRIASVPMTLLANGETGTVYYHDFEVRYDPAPTSTVVDVFADDFSTAEDGTEFGDRQPVGWTEFGQDWYQLPAEGWATVWNPAYTGDTASLPVDAGMVQVLSMPSLQDGDRLHVQGFAAATFTDPTSFVRLRVVFQGTEETAFESDRLSGTNYSFLNIRGEAVPTDFDTAYLVVNAYLGPNEASSLYVDDVRLWIERQ